MKMRITVLATLALIGVGVAGAFAEDAKPAVPAQDNKPTATAPATRPALSESKFLGALYSEIARRTPQENKSGPGEVTASFHVDAHGKVDKVAIDKTTSPAHAEIVKKILESVHVSSPPGGSMDVGQTFKFR